MGCGFGTNQAANVVSNHALAMFAPSFVTGKLIEKYGEKSIISTGNDFILACSPYCLSRCRYFELLHIININWYRLEFQFHRVNKPANKKPLPVRKGKVQGINDFFVFGFVALSSVTSGWLMNCSANSSQLGWEVVNLSATPLVILP